jgi:hypothetical protein
MSFIELFSTWVSESNALFVERRRRRNIFTRIAANVFHVIRSDARIVSSGLRNRRIAGNARLESKIDDMMRTQDEFNRKLVERVDGMMRTQDEFNRLFVDRLTRLEDKVDLIGQCSRSKLDEMSMLEDRMVDLFMKLDVVASTTDNVRRISLNNTMLAVSVAEKTGVTQNEISNLVGMVHKRVEE